MDKIIDAIKCHHCRQILNIPILLPCGHSMCKVHADEASDQVKCPKCGVWHQNQGFVVVSELLKVVDSKISTIDFGPSHKEAKQACNKLEDILDQMGDMVKDPIYFSHKAIDDLRNQVFLKSVQLKLEIDKKTEELLAVLSDYQNKCELNFEKSKLESCMRNLENIKNETKKMIKESKDFLDRLIVDDEKWRKIKKECDSKAEELSKDLELFKKLLFMNELEEKRAQVDHFINVDLTPLFRFEDQAVTDQPLINNSKPKTSTIGSITPNDNHTTQQLLEKFQISPQTEITNRSILVNQPTTLNLSAPGNISGPRSPPFKAINFGTNDDNKPQILVQHVGLSSSRNEFEIRLSCDSNSEKLKEILSTINLPVNKRTMLIAGDYIKANGGMERFDEEMKKRAHLNLQVQQPRRPPPPPPPEQIQSTSNHQFRPSQALMRAQTAPSGPPPPLSHPKKIL